MAGTVIADRLEAASTSQMVIENGVALTPPTIADVNGVAIGTFCRAWVNFNGQGTVAIMASFNVSSITDNGVGNYTVNFTNAMPDANYGITGFTRRELAGFAAVVLSAGSTDTKTTTTCQIRTGFSATAGDQPENGIAIFR